MDIDPVIVGVNQSNTIALQEAQTSGLEAYSEIWQSAQDLVHPDVRVRRAGFARLVDMQAARYYPLAAYLLTTRITEPDIQLRSSIVREIAAVFAPDLDGMLPPDEVRNFLVSALAQMRKRPIYALLQVSSADPQMYPQVVRLIGKCSFAGTQLADILADRQAPMGIRHLAVRLIGDIGYLSAKPLLERQAARLENRQNGQNGCIQPGEIGLIPAITEALNKLNH